MNASIGLDLPPPVCSPYEWLGRVLVGFAHAEQAIGRLSLALGLPIETGSLSSLTELRRRLQAADDKGCRELDKKIASWNSDRPKRHLLAHATLRILRDDRGREIVVTRHLPRSKNDVTPDLMWSLEERQEILRYATNDGRSIADQVKNLLGDQSRLAKLKSA